MINEVCGAGGGVRAEGGEVIRAEKGAWRREPYLMEQPGGRLRHARGEKKKGNKSRNAAAVLLDPSLSAPWRAGLSCRVPGWGGATAPGGPGWVGWLGGLLAGVGLVRDRLREEARVCTWSLQEGGWDRFHRGVIQ